MSETLYAKCPACGFVAPLRKNGTLGRHWVYVGDRGTPCIGIGWTTQSEALTKCRGCGSVTRLHLDGCGEAAR